MLSDYYIFIVVFQVIIVIHLVNMDTVHNLEFAPAQEHGLELNVKLV